MIAHAEDVEARAAYLIKRATQNGKPLRVFLGFRSLGHGQHVLVAFDDAKNVCKSLPREELTVTADMAVPHLAEQLRRGWAALTERNNRPANTRAPAAGHLWRKSRGLARTPA